MSNHLNLIGAVLVRPKMYTISGSYGQTIAFLTGYINGIARHNPYTQLVVEWSDFQDWLASQIQAEQSDVFSSFLAQHGNEGEALAHLRQLYEEFKEAYVPRTIIR